MTALWNGLKIAFSMYSKIPMPKSDWTRENMRFVMCFFPLVGSVIGLLVYGWRILAEMLGITQGQGSVFFVVLLLLIPVIVTGGIHLDGYLDTCDALSSWQTREKRLEILKDPRAGAFAVIMGGVYFLLSYGVYTLLENEVVFFIVCLNFVLSRAFSGLAIVTFPMAKNTGLAATFSDGAQKRTVGIWMGLYIGAAGGAMLLTSIFYGSLAIITALAVFGYYRWMSYKNFGGITGDLAGWFLQICELAVPLVLGVASLVV